jgi:hypothetical protein
MNNILREKNVHVIQSIDTGMIALYNLRPLGVTSLSLDLRAK